MSSTSGARSSRCREDERIEENKVRGCQSQVWMVAELDAASGKVAIRADSDAFIVRGLIALLLRLYADRPAEEILANPPAVFETIGLGAHLSPTRGERLARDDQADPAAGVRPGPRRSGRGGELKPTSGGERRQISGWGGGHEQARPFVGRECARGVHHRGDPLHRAGWSRSREPRAPDRLLCRGRGRRHHGLGHDG